MHPPSRARRILKWTGVVAWSATAVAAILSVFSHASYRGDTWAIVSDGGDIRISTRSPSPSSPFRVITSKDGNTKISTPNLPKSKLVADFRAKLKGGRLQWNNAPAVRLSMPGIRPISRWDRQFVIPYWLTLALVGAPTLLLWNRDRRLISSSPDHRHCLRCGYDLTGNTSGVCPECGDNACPPAVLEDSECGKKTAMANSEERMAD